MIQLKLPITTLDRRGIQSGKFKSCFSFMVMLYFLQNLSKSHEFSVDFAHPIDGSLAAFLQSTASVESLAIGGGLNLDDISISGTSMINDDTSEVMNQVIGGDSDTLSQFSSVSNTRDTGSQPSLRNHSVRNAQENEWKHASQTSNMIRPTSASGFSHISTNTSLQNELDNLGFGSVSQHDRHSISSLGSLQITSDNIASIHPSWEEDPVYKIDAIRVGPNRIDTNTQTLLTSRKIEKILIRSMKQKRMLEDAYSTVEKLSKGDKNIMNLTSAEIDSQKVDIIWKNQRNKLRGELLLTKMRYEIESLNRKVIYLNQQKEFGIKQANHKYEELKAKFDSDILYQIDQARTSATSEQIALLNERLKEREDFDLELKRIRQEIAFEADRIRQGGLHADDDDAIEDEILRLRQLTLTQANQIKTFEESNTILNTMVKSLQNQLREVQDKNKELYNHYRLQDENLIGESKKKFERIYQNMTPTEIERQIHNNHEDYSSQSKIERLLLLENTKLQNELNSLQSDYNTELEHLKYELFKYQQQPASKLLNIDAMEADFDKDQTIDRLESEIERLKRVNNYLRERSVVFDKFNSNSTEQDEADEDETPLGSELGDSRINQKSSLVADSALAPDVWLPSLYIGNSSDDMDDADGKILSILRGLDQIGESQPQVKSVVSEATKLFWKMISDQAIFIQRIKKSRYIILDLYQQTKKIEDDDVGMKTEHIMQSEKARSQHRIEIEDLKHKFVKEQASLLVKLQLTEDSLKESRDMILEAPHRYRQLIESAITDDESRFNVLCKKLREKEGEISAYKLREKLWTHLIECQRNNIELTEKLSKCQDYNEAVKLNKQREELDLEATSCVQQLQALTQHHHEGVRIKSQGSTQDIFAKERDVDILVEEATALLKSQISQLTDRIEELLRERELILDRSNDFEHQVKDLQLGLAKVQKVEQTLQSEISQLHASKYTVVEELNRLKAYGSEQVRQLQLKLQEMEDLIQEMKNNPDSYFFDHDTNATNVAQLHKPISEQSSEAKQNAPKDQYKITHEVRHNNEEYFNRPIIHTTRSSSQEDFAEEDDEDLVVDEIAEDEEQGELKDNYEDELLEDEETEIEALPRKHSNFSTIRE